VADLVRRSHRLEHVERHERERVGMVAARRRDARGHHVTVADRLDLLEVVLLGERVEVAEQMVEVPDDLARREPLRPGREVDHVREQDRSRLEVIRDRLALGLQLLCDRARQDVEQEVLRLGLLHLECSQRVSALLREHREEREHDRAADGDVQRQHRRGEPVRGRVPDRADELACEPRPEEYDDERRVPADC
jgi:hypothetical protein